MSKYERIMEEITISDSSRERILDQVLKEGEDDHKVKNSRRWFSGYTAVAACLAVLLIGMIPVFNRSSYEPDMMAEGNLRIEDISKIEEMAEDAVSLIECRSAEQLGEQVGFVIRDIDSLKEISKEVHYYAYGQLAEIIYSTDHGEACYRKSAAAEAGSGGDDSKKDNVVKDNSGHDNEYGQEEKVSAGESTVTLRGEGDLYYLGIWQSGTYIYSLYMPEGMNREEWINLLKF